MCHLNHQRVLSRTHTSATTGQILCENQPDGGRASERRTPPVQAILHRLTREDGRSGSRPGRAPTRNSSRLLAGSL